MKSIEDHKESLESNGSCGISESSDSKCTKEPCQTKEGHDTCNTDKQSDGCFLTHLFFGTTKCFLSVLDEDNDHHEEYDNIKIRMAKMGPKKAPKNTAGSEIKQLEEENKAINYALSATEYECHILNVLSIQ